MKTYRYSLSNIIGHERAVRELRKRLIRQRHEDPLMLVGPAGIGKKLLARAYSAAIRCESAGRDDLSEPCTICQSCRHFPNVLHYVEIRPSASQAEERLLELIKGMSKAAWGNRRIIILNNAQDSPKLVQACLLTLEKRYQHVSIIFVAKYIDATMRAAASRFQVLRLHCLANDSLIKLAQRHLDEEMPGASNDAAALLARASSGRPGRLMSLVNAVVQAQAMSDQALADTLRFTILRDAIVFWSQVVSVTSPSEVIHNEHTQQWTMARRVVLLELGNVLDTGEVNDAAIKMLYAGAMEELVSSLRSASAKTGLSPAELWAGLAACWNGEQAETAFADHRRLQKLCKVMVQK